ncbi:RidA family protein [Ralstonia soli]|uniref:RidA family protein n=1 Tax=Ralstonia soli TaxID=2953896 RepID=A0ABT1AEC7_9RALS|nr:RidA family protein [Ralstonia soli]MCO5396684.1 RidA family protein [Ralstonia soli]
MLTAINQPGISYPGISQAIQGAGDVLVLGGHVSADEKDNFVDGDFETQVRNTFRALERTLRAAGADFDAVARFTYYVPNFDESLLPIFKRVRAEFIVGKNPPASTFIPVVKLFDPRARIEVDGIAVVPSKIRIA